MPMKYVTLCCGSVFRLKKKKVFPPTCICKKCGKDTLLEKRNVKEAKS
jgi:uncharacterized OB-fold protein